MCRGLGTYLVTFNNSTATHQVSDCHHQLLLFVLLIFICIANMGGKFYLRKFFC
jgi:hypothetical protein